MITVKRQSRIVLVSVLLVLLSVLPAKAAIVTQPFTSFGNGLVTVTFDWNENNGDVKRFECVNNSNFDAWFGVYLSGVLQYEKICPAQGTTVQVVAGTNLAWDTVDGGLIFGDYSFGAVWPYTP